MYHKFSAILLLVLVPVALIGCGGNRAQVSGTVAFEDGTPLTKGSVKAGTSDGIEVKGIIKQDGTFTLFEVKPGDGIPSGKQYKIWIVNAVEVIPSAQSVQSTSSSSGASPPPSVPPLPPKELVHRNFTSAEKTPLTLDVPSGSPTLSHDITVKKP